jgi:hypothetical protein
MGVGVRAGQRLDVEGAVEQPDSVGDEDVRGVLRLGCLVEPAGRVVLALEGGESPDRRGAGERERGWGGARLRLARPPPAAGGRRRGAQRLDDEDALAAVLAGQVAAVREGQRAGEVELRESE